MMMSAFGVFGSPLLISPKKCHIPPNPSALLVKDILSTLVIAARLKEAVLPGDKWST